MFYVMESAIVNEQQANMIHVKESINEARMVFHQVRASQLANDNVTYGIAMVIDEEGRVYESEYHRHVVTEEPENNENAGD